MEKELKALRMGFHPSKEGFKVWIVSPSLPQAPGFHPSKEGFKVGGVVHDVVIREVSIPLRKVSRGPEGPLCYCLPTGFHPSKEGFKASTVFYTFASQLVSIPLRKVSRADGEGVEGVAHGFPSL